MIAAEVPEAEEVDLPLEGDQPDPVVAHCPECTYAIKASEVSDLSVCPGCGIA